MMFNRPRGLKQESRSDLDFLREWLCLLAIITLPNNCKFHICVESWHELPQLVLMLISSISSPGAIFGTPFCQAGIRILLIVDVIEAVLLLVEFPKLIVRLAPLIDSYFLVCFAPLRYKAEMITIGDRREAWVALV